MKKNSADDTRPEEDYSSKGLVELPTSLNFETLSSVSFDGNKLDHLALDTLIKQASNLLSCSFRGNHVVVVPSSVGSHKRLKSIALDGNPIGWPRAPDDGNWKRAVSSEPPGRRVFRMYLDADQQQQEQGKEKVSFVDFEVVCMVDPMFEDKDEDRADVRMQCSWKQQQDGFVTLRHHDRSLRNKWGDPDELRKPWYRNERKKKVYPIQCLVVGVFDGHGGNWVSTALKQHLYRRLIDAGIGRAVSEKKGLPEVYKKNPLDQDKSGDMWRSGHSAEDWGACEEEIANAVGHVYLDLDKALLEKMPPGQKDGSTCVSCVIGPQRTVVSHVGDSRCAIRFAEGISLPKPRVTTSTPVLLSDKKAASPKKSLSSLFRGKEKSPIDADGAAAQMTSGDLGDGMEQVTLDHEPCVAQERQRVERMGGRVERHATPQGGGVWRVCGDLSMTRSFGDGRLKKSGLTSVPDVAIRMGAMGICDAVIATDGLWHHVGSKEALVVVQQARHAEEAAVKLYQMLESRIKAGKNDAYGRDNTTIVVIKAFQGSQPKDVPVLKSPV